MDVNGELHDLAVLPLGKLPVGVVLEAKETR
jgi:hypothetical protein